MNRDHDLRCEGTTTLRLLCLFSLLVARSSKRDDRTYVTGISAQRSSMEPGLASKARSSSDGQRQLEKGRNVLKRNVTSSQLCNHKPISTQSVILEFY